MPCQGSSDKAASGILSLPLRQARSDGGQACPLAFAAGILWVDRIKSPEHPFPSSFSLGSLSSLHPFLLAPFLLQSPGTVTGTGRKPKGLPRMCSASPHRAPSFWPSESFMITYKVQLTGLSECMQSCPRTESHQKPFVKIDYFIYSQKSHHWNKSKKLVVWRSMLTLSEDTWPLFSCTSTVRTPPPCRTEALSSILAPTQLRTHCHQTGGGGWSGSSWGAKEGCAGGLLSDFHSLMEGNTMENTFKEAHYDEKCQAGQDAKQNKDLHRSNNICVFSIMGSAHSRPIVNIPWLKPKKWLFKSWVKLGSNYLLPDNFLENNHIVTPCGILEILHNCRSANASRSWCRGATKETLPQGTSPKAKVPNAAVIRSLTPWLGTRK